MQKVHAHDRSLLRLLPVHDKGMEARMVMAGRAGVKEGAAYEVHEAYAILCPCRRANAVRGARAVCPEEGEW